MICPATTCTVPASLPIGSAAAQTICPAIGSTAPARRPASPPTYRATSSFGPARRPGSLVDRAEQLWMSEKMTLLADRSRLITEVKKIFLYFLLLFFRHSDNLCTNTNILNLFRTTDQCNRVTDINPKLCVCGRGGRGGLVNKTPRRCKVTPCSGFNSRPRTPEVGCGRPEAWHVPVIHWLIHYMNTWAKYRHLKKFTCKGTLRQMFISPRPPAPPSFLFGVVEQFCRFWIWSDTYWVKPL